VNGRGQRGKKKGVTDHTKGRTCLSDQTIREENALSAKLNKGPCPNEKIGQGWRKSFY